MFVIANPYSLVQYLFEGSSTSLTQLKTSTNSQDYFLWNLQLLPFMKLCCFAYVQLLSFKEKMWTSWMVFWRSCVMCCLGVQVWGRWERLEGGVLPFQDTWHASIKEESSPLLWHGSVTSWNIFYSTLTKLRLRQRQWQHQHQQQGEVLRETWRTTIKEDNSSLKWHWKNIIQGYETDHI